MDNSINNGEISGSLGGIVGRGTLFLSFGNVILKILGLAIVFLTLHVLTVYEYGAVRLVLSIFAVGVIFLLSNLGDMVIADMGVEKNSNLGRMKSVFLNFFRLQSILAIIAWIVMFFGADLYDLYFNSGVSGFLKITSFMFLIYPVREAYTILFNVYLRFSYISIQGVIEEIIRFILLLVFLIGFNKKIDGVLYAQLFSQIFGMVIMAPFFWNLYKDIHGTDEEISSISEILKKHGKWNVMTSLISNLNKNIRIWFIKLFLGTEAVGLFSVANSLVGHTQSLIPMGNVITPIIPQYINDRERFNRIITKGAKYQSLLYLFIGALAFVFFPPLINWIFPKYSDALILYRVMLLVLIPSSFISVITSTYYALKAQKELFFAYVARIIMTIVLLPFAVGYFGILGAGYEYIISATLFVILRYKMLKKILPEFKLSLISFFKFDQYDKVIFNQISVIIKRKLILLFNKRYI